VVLYPEIGLDPHTVLVDLVAELGSAISRDAGLEEQLNCPRVASEIIAGPDVPPQSHADLAQPTRGSRQAWLRSGGDWDHAAGGGHSFTFATSARILANSGSTCSAGNEMWKPTLLR